MTALRPFGSAGAVQMIGPLSVEADHLRVKKIKTISLSLELKQI